MADRAMRMQRCEAVLEPLDLSMKSNSTATPGHVFQSLPERGPFQGNTCEKNFAQNGQLRSHIKLVILEPLDLSMKSNFTTTADGHSRSPAKLRHFQCRICEKIFARNSHLRSHIRLVHLGIKPFKCDLCEDKKFGRNCDLLRHLRIHTGVKPFECPHCQKAFGTTAYLRRHLSVHSSEKPFECDKCEKKFAGKSSLNRHLRKHTEQRPFQCNECHKRFGEKFHLQHHLRTHSGSGPSFQCDQCEKKLSTKYNLRRHLQRTHAGRKPFSFHYTAKRDMVKNSS